MLKVTVVDTAKEARVKVEGDLAGPSVTELESVWKYLCQARENRKILVDLSGTTAIDAGGKRMLMVMASQGAQLIAKGVYTEYVVKGLVERVNAGCRS
jgi:hypothetical protein